VQARAIIPYVLAWEDNEGIREYGYEPGLFITGHDHDKNAQRSFSVKNIVPLSGETIIHDFRDYVPKQSIAVLVDAAKKLANSVKKDEFGTPLMQFKDGNGGLVSKETLNLVTQLEQLLEFYK
jgi:hypothetical protein